MKRIVAMSGQERPWLNYELAKDCGIVPYLMMKNHGCDVSMVCGGDEEYPYLDIMPGFKVERLIDNSIASKVKYLEENGANIDLVMLYGITDHNIVMADTIKKTNDKCMITCALDMNPDFADRVPFHLSPFYEYLDSIDLMWQSDTDMTEFLNEKWYWKVECARNGYYNIEEMTSDIEYYPFEKRENILLYVGRIDDFQKNIGMLLRAFAAIAELIPEWKLRLVGPIENPFEEYIDEFWITHVNLRDRIEFAGNILDRRLLHKEYEHAKVFVSASRYEGGTPNAISEAICSGCVMAITKIAAYRDILGNNETGACSDIENESAYAEMLYKLLHEDLKAMSMAAYERGRKMYNMERIVADLYGKLCLKGF